MRKKNYIWGFVKLILMVIIGMSILSACSDENDNSESNNKKQDAESMSQEGGTEAPEKEPELPDQPIEEIPDDNLEIILKNPFFLEFDILSRSNRQVKTTISGLHSQNENDSLVQLGSSEWKGIYKAIGILILSNGEEQTFEFTKDELETGLILRTIDLSINILPMALQVMIFEESGKIFRSEIVDFQLEEEMNALRTTIEFSPEGTVMITPNTSYRLTFDIQFGDKLSFSSEDQVTSFLDLEGQIHSVTFGEIIQNDLKGSLFLNSSNFKKTGFLNLVISRNGVIRYEGNTQVKLDKITSKVSLKLRNQSIFPVLMRISEDSPGILQLELDLESLFETLADLGFEKDSLVAKVELEHLPRYTNITDTVIRVEFEGFDLMHSYEFNLELLHHGKVIAITGPKKHILNPMAPMHTLNLIIDRHFTGSTEKLGGVSYYVVDGKNNQPLSDVIVIVKDTVFTKTSDHLGYVNFLYGASLAEGIYNVVFLKTGFASRIIEQRIYSGKFPMVQITMDRYR